MNNNYEKTLEKLSQIDAMLQKTEAKKKSLEAQKRELLEKSENERLVSRGQLLESFLKEPLVLTNDDIASLLDLMFRSSFSQKNLDRLINSRKGFTAEIFDDDAEESE